MAQTATAINECNVVIRLDNASGTLTDISGSSNAVSLTFSNAVTEFKHYDGDNPTRLLVGQDVAIDIVAVYSTTDDEALDLLRDWSTGAISGTDERTIRISIPDETVGSDRYEAEVIPATLDVPFAADNAGPVVVSATLNGTGDYTVGRVTTSTSTTTTSTSSSTTTFSVSTSLSTTTSTSSSLSTSTTTT
jgi:hypothetical protein